MGFAAPEAWFGSDKSGLCWCQSASGQELHGAGHDYVSEPLGVGDSQAGVNVQRWRAGLK